MRLTVIGTFHRRFENSLPLRKRALDIDEADGRNKSNGGGQDAGKLANRHRI